MLIHTDARDKNGDTPLHDACRNGQLSVIEYLLEKAHCDVGMLTM